MFYSRRITCDDWQLRIEHIWIVFHSFQNCLNSQMDRRIVPPLSPPKPIYQTPEVKETKTELILNKKNARMAIPSKNEVTIQR